MSELFKLKNGTVLLSTEAPGGIYNSAQLKKIAELCSKDLAIVKATEDQRLALFVKEGDLHRIADELKATGLGFRNYQSGLHQPMACLGELCESHEQPALATAMDLTKLIAPISLTSPLKIGINGCARCCMPCHTLDISVIGESGGYRLNLGGKTTQFPELASYFAEGIPARELPALITKVIDIYKSKAEDGETFQEVLERCGTKDFVKALAPYSQDAAGGDDLFAEESSNDEVSAERPEEILGEESAEIAMDATDDLLGEATEELISTSEEGADLALDPLDGLGGEADIPMNAGDLEMPMDEIAIGGDGDGDTLKDEITFDSDDNVRLINDATLEGEESFDTMTLRDDDEEQDLATAETKGTASAADSFAESEELLPEITEAEPEMLTIEDELAAIEPELIEEEIPLDSGEEIAAIDDGIEGELVFDDEAPITLDHAELETIDDAEEESIPLDESAEEEVELIADAAEGDLEMEEIHDIDEDDTLDMPELGEELLETSEVDPSALLPDDTDEGDLMSHEEEASFERKIAESIAEDKKMREADDGIDANVSRREDALRILASGEGEDDFSEPEIDTAALLGVSDEVEAAPASPAYSGVMEENIVASGFDFDGVESTDKGLRVNFSSGAFMDIGLNSLAAGKSKVLKISGQPVTITHTEQGFTLEVDGMRMFYPHKVLRRAS